MAKKNPYIQLILFSICICFMANCKSDNSKIETKESESTNVVIAKPDERITLGSNTIPVEEDTIGSASSELIAEVESPPKEIKKETPAPKKEIKKPRETKPQTTPKKKKPIKVVKRSKPKIQFEELVWNFGEITEGDIIEKKFKFTNTGNAPLEIIATSATCGCTRPSFPFLDIAPGESNVIGVTYNSVGKDGEQDPEVTIESNAEPKITIIKLHGTVKPKPKEEEKSDSTSVVQDSVLSKY